MKHFRKSKVSRKFQKKRIPILGPDMIHTTTNGLESNVIKCSHFKHYPPKPNLNWNKRARLVCLYVPHNLRAQLHTEQTECPCRYVRALFYPFNLVLLFRNASFSFQAFVLSFSLSFTFICFASRPVNSFPRFSFFFFHSFRMFCSHWNADFVQVISVWTC